MRLRPIVAGAVAVAGALIAVGATQLPAFGSVPAATTVTPTSASQELVCPGAAVEVGAAGHRADAITAVGSPTVQFGTASGATAQSRLLGAGGVSGAKNAAPLLITAPAAKTSEDVLVGAQTQLVTSGDAQGLVATECAAPAAVTWLVGGATTTGRTSVLLLANASGVDATVSVDAWSGQGSVDTSQLSGIAVPAHSRVAVSVAAIAPNTEALAFRVTSEGGRVQASLEQRTVRGLESGGIDVVGPATAPALSQTVTGVAVVGSVLAAQAGTASGYGDLAPVVRVFVPGSAAATVHIRVSGATKGTANAAITQRVVGGHVADIELPGLTDGVYTVEVTASHPVTAAVRTSSVVSTSGSTTAGGSTVDATTGAISRHIDLAWLTASPVLGSSATVAVAAGATSQLVLTNDTAEPASVRLTGATTSTVQVPAGGTTTVGVAAGVIHLTGAAGLRAAVSVTTTSAGVAGYPVLADSTAARAVQVTG